ncbi:uncharacterized protein LOC110419445 isoform X1 [Herrania umbratica]|uniref:Uncharacterized protein LOC110419445 isoform X1 n=1 Tax=Herrania umbratica TaxID=108875 RepID=A0A6J1AMT2_9ROSI|nr:uncharacterized protein LOC110419445 isoform X1 [Herrania umbratica]
MLLINSRIIPLPSPSTTLLQLHKASPCSTKLLANKFIPCRRRKREWIPHTLMIKVSSSSSAVENHSPATVSPGSQGAVEVIRSFYAGINSHDLASVQLLIAEECVYEDLTFPRPFVGRKAFLEAYKSFVDSMSMDLQMVVDDITSNEESSTVGVAWHFEWKGKVFPYSKGCSFYRLQMVDGTRQIIYGRDVVEPSIKLGEAGLAAMKGVMWLLQQFPQLEDQL